MCVLLSTYEAPWDVEPLVGLAVQLRGHGAEVRVCAPPDCAEWLAGAGVPLVPACRWCRSADRRAAALVAAQFDTVAAAAEGCDALGATA